MILFSFDFMCMRILPVCMYAYHFHILWFQRSEEGIRSPGTGMTIGCELNPDPPEEQPVLSTAEPVLQLHNITISSLSLKGSQLFLY